MKTKKHVNCSIAERKYVILFHKNACSLNKNFDDLQQLLSCTKIFLT